MNIILTPNAPAPGGHYSQAIAHNGLVFISGILPIEPSGRKLNDFDINKQTKQVFANLKAILEAAGSEPNKVLKTTVFISDMSLWVQVNVLYAEFFGEHRPARSVVPVKKLHYGLSIELEAIATL